MSLEDIMLNEISQKDEYHILSLIYKEAKNVDLIEVENRIVIREDGKGGGGSSCIEGTTSTVV
jgi:hypothetical protein